MRDESSEASPAVSANGTVMPSANPMRIYKKKHDGQRGDFERREVVHLARRRGR